jgi:drug/metabolite transporter (DMT)-like permease
MNESIRGSGQPARAGHVRGLAAIHLAVFLFGLSGLLGKMLSAPPVLIVFGRALLAALVLSPALWFWAGKPSASRRAWLFLTGSGVILAIHWVSFFTAIQLSTVAIGLLSFSSFPLFATILEPLIFHERLRWLDIWACGLVTIGLGLVVPNLDLHQAVTRGAAWGIVSGLTFALLALFNRKFVGAVPALAIAAGQNTVAAMVLLPFLGPLTWTASSHDLLLLAFLGLFCTAGAHALFIGGLATVRAQVASVLSALEPIYGILFAWLLLGEAPTLRTLAGGLLILSAILLCSRK